MRRRQALRIGGAALLGGSLATGRAAAHGRPDPNSDGEAPTAGEDATAATAGFEPLGRLAVPGAKELVVDGTTAFVAVSDGFATVDVSDPADPSILAERRDLLADHPDGPLEEVYDGKVGGGYYAVGGPGRDATGALEAAAVYDISDPADPERVLAYETDFYHHNLDTDGETLYLCGNDGDQNPLVCVDVATGAELGRWSVLDADERWANVDHRLREIHDVWVEDGVAYVACWNAGTWLVDVSDPADPETIVGLRGLVPDEQASVRGDAAIRRGRFQLPGNDHFAMPRQPGPGAEGAAGAASTEEENATTPTERGEGRHLLALNEEAWGETADAPTSDLGTVELWDAAAETRLASLEAPPTPDATYEGVWTTPHNFAYVGDALYTAWYRGGVQIHDVSDPTAPEELAHWRDTATTAFWTVQPAETCLVASSWRNPSADDPEAGAAVCTFPDREALSDLDAGDATTTTEGDGTGFGLLAGALGFGLGAAAVARRFR